MKHRNIWTGLFAAGFVLSGAIQAETLLVMQPNFNSVVLPMPGGGEIFGSGYGTQGWSGFTADLNAAFGASNITMAAHSRADAAYVNGFDSLMVVPLAGPFHYGDTAMSPQQIRELETFIASGRRVLLFGDSGSSNYDDWTRSLLTSVGGQWAGDVPISATSPVVSNSLTAGVTSLNLGGEIAATASGGTSLFDQSVATVWNGNGSDNALSILRLNAMADYRGNTQFAENVADWLAGATPATPTAVPEPSPVLLLAGALLFLAAFRRRAAW